ncbi:hypothetical protein [Stutzerimonas stutzeri]|uniref:hypothetical protein n=1 Tax=Stutzerimonas stutzeri TaxID=316 RepID=UPI003EE038FE
MDRALGNPLGNPLGLARAAGFQPEAVNAVYVLSREAPAGTKLLEIVLPEIVIPDQCIVTLDQTCAVIGNSTYGVFEFTSIDESKVTLESYNSFSTVVEVKVTELKKQKVVRKFQAQAPSTINAAPAFASIPIPGSPVQKGSTCDVVYKSETVPRTYYPDVMASINSAGTHVDIVYQSTSSSVGPYLLFQIVEGGY